MLRKNRKKTKSAPRFFSIATTFGILMLLFAAAFLFEQHKDVIRVGNAEFIAEVVDTPQARQKGLSGRADLPENHAMLFVFEEPGEHCFWMKDMNFSIDIMWLDSAKQVIDYEKGVSPSSFPSTFCPSRPAHYVLEVNSGQIESNEINIGDQAEF